ncbi:glycosyltransferase family 9 protein [Arhodomonas sp. AD133]|uniref:glycosyltransferase family 9 protein n=1 Tax=Arhodomonas sp. AD133 TaxID=3415009 RepID=UPI003EBFFCD5
MRRILVIRLSALGDIVMASGLIPALRARWPDAHIAWLAEPAGASLLQANPRLDEVMVWPRGEWQRLRGERRYPELVRSVRAFVRELRAREFDLVLDTQGLLKSGSWARITGAGERIGIASREGSERLMTRVLAPPRDDPRIGSEYRALAEHLGVDAQRFPMDLALAEDDRAAAREAVSGAGVVGDHVVFAPFTTRPQKHWFEERWRCLAGHFSAEAGVTPVILGGGDDREAAARLTADTAAVSLAGKLSLRASAAVVAGARALVGVDTALTHMGSAFNVPTVALFGSTRPYLETDSPVTRVLYEPLWCSPCRRRPLCGGVFSCMRLHRADDVYALTRSLMEAA